MKPWIRDCWKGEVLTREEFICRYFPKYQTAWRPRTGIILRSDGRPTRATTAGDYKSQETKRKNRIDRAFAEYCALVTEANKPLNETQ